MSGWSSTPSTSSTSCAPPRPPPPPPVCAAPWNPRARGCRPPAPGRLCEGVPSCCRGWHGVGGRCACHDVGGEQCRDGDAALRQRMPGAKVVLSRDVQGAQGGTGNAAGAIQGGRRAGRRHPGGRQSHRDLPEERGGRPPPASAAMCGLRPRLPRPHCSCLWTLPGLRSMHQAQHAFVRPTRPLA